MVRTMLFPLVGAMVLGGCATTTPGARPGDMSEAAHQREAQKLSTTAAQHQAEYDPSAKATRERCRAAGGHSRHGGLDAGDVCWTSITNPTETHLRQAAEHRRMAADHRAASSALRDAEARACVGIKLADRDISPLEHVEDISSVEPLKDRIGMGKSSSERMAGVVVTLRAVPGMTAEWLQRVADCHLARNASLGHVAPEMPNCPLVPKGVTARVTSTGNGFAVAIRSNEDEAAKEILARARRLRSAPTQSPTSAVP